MNKITSLILFVFISVAVKSQDLPKDTLYGNVKRIREKVIFLREKEKTKFKSDDDDEYGEFGLREPEKAISTFYKVWFASPMCYFINYDRRFDKKRKIIKEVWFGKKNDFLHSYRYLYDKKDRLISTIDSSDYSVDTKSHYFEEHGDYVDENIIFESIKSNVFYHRYMQYKKGKVIKSKSFDDNGTVYETINHYNDNGKLAYRITKSPNSWKKAEGNSWSFGVQDSIGVTYKSLINEYDSKNRLIKTKTFDLDEENYSNDIVEVDQTTNIYDGNNLITNITSRKNREPGYFYYKYDNYNRLIEKYCWNKDISKARLIQKYSYKDGKISQFIYCEASSENNKMKNYNISYAYKYDNNKNWIEIIKTVNGITLYKWVRKIEYY